MFEKPIHARLMLAGLSLLILAVAGCGGGDSSSNSADNGSGDGATQQLANAQGTIVLPNGASGVAIVHIEDADGSLMSTPSSANIPTAVPVTLVAEPPDFSQGIIAGGQTVQTLNTAATSPQITDNVQLTAGAEPISLAVIADTTFSVVQMAQLTDYTATCFTGGLHLATQQAATGQPMAIAYVVSPDGSGMVASMATGGLQFFALSPMTDVHGENINASIFVPDITPAITGRGALAWDPTSDTVLAGGQDGSLTAVSGLKSATQVTNTIYLPGTPAVASIAYAPSGQYAVVATASGLFTVAVDSSGTPTVLSGPINPSYTLSNGGAYQLDQAQSIAITADGNFLVALTDEPSQSSGTLVAMPIDASGSVGAVGMVQSGFLATQGVDVLFAH